MRPSKSVTTPSSSDMAVFYHRGTVRHMGIGHLAVGFAAKRAVPRVSLAILLFAATFVDVLWGLFVLTGLEHARPQPGATAAMPFDLYDYPFSHSLLAGIMWALVFGATFRSFKQYRAGAVMLGFVVLSHWVLDVVSHRPDMPLFLRGPYLGLGLWNSVPASIVVEELMLAAGVILYVKATHSGANVGLGILVAVLAIMGVVGYLAPPPPSIVPLAAGNLIIPFIALPVAYAIDKRRSTA
jgi:hypothetical protein